MAGNKWRKTIFNMAHGCLTLCNVARSPSTRVCLGGLLDVVIGTLQVLASRIEMYALEVSRYRHGRYRYLTQNIGDIDILKFTVAFFGLLVYFIIVSKLSSQ